MKEFFEAHNFERALSVHSVDLNTGVTVIFDETIPLEHRTEVISSSGMMPVFFEPIEYEKYFLIDGGLFSNLNFHESILRCREKGFADEDIIVDIIACFDIIINEKTMNWEKKDIKWKTAYDMKDRKY